MPTLKSVLNITTSHLNSVDINTPHLDAEILLSYVLKKPKEFLYTHPEYNLDKYQITNIKSLISRRIKGEPIAYLTSHKEFYGLDFLINKTVLIPRPEAELLVEKILKQISNSKYQITIAEIGTGSGCLAIALAKNNPQLKIYATDICKQALKVAQKNAQKHQVEKKIKFFQGNLLEPLKNLKLDALVANLPYLTKKEYQQESSIQFEPKKALVAGSDGLKYFKELFKQINKFKNYPKFIYLEIGDKQNKELKKIAKKYLPQYKVQTKKDLAGLDRLIILKFSKIN